jgi:hydroxymethylpyrimidine pyrophosphatase-like HAD family hydrolase
LADLPLQPVVGEAASLELTPAGVSKALGLKLLCEHLGLSLAQCVAVGDAGNDLDVLQAAGHAVAMGNATPEARAVADEVVADNDHDGIAEVIARWF